MSIEYNEEFTDKEPRVSMGTVGFYYGDGEKDKNWEEPKIGLFSRINRAYQVLRYGDWQDEDGWDY